MAFRKVAQFKEVSLEYVSPTAAGSFKLFTDMPGNHLADRTGVKVLPATNADKTPNTITFPLVDGNGAPLEGTLYYPRVDPPASGALQLRGGVIWMRPIGVYLDGTLGEFFETLPIPVGV
jgi:hypothetical protein